MKTSMKLKRIAIMGMPSAAGKRTLRSKMEKTRELKRHPGIRSIIPETQLMTRDGLERMLRRYRLVYVKPVQGSQGQGVIRAEQIGRGRNCRYIYQLGTKPRSFASFDRFYRSLLRSKLRRQYLMQRGIPLLTYRNRRFDVRIMVQRTSRLPWRSTGYIGRLSHPRHIVTNYHSEGTPMALEQLLSPYMSGKIKLRYIAGLRRIGTGIARHLNKKYRNFREIGVDIGIDQRLKPWLIEVNTAPDAFIFRELKNKRMFRTVLRYSQANGRYKRTKR
jgi:hypothetical protein